MKRFIHIDAKSLEDATNSLKEYENSSYVIAGGTDLLGCLKDNLWLEYPKAIVNLKTIDGLNYIKKSEDGIHIGALTTLTNVAESSDIKKYCNALSIAASRTASPILRNMATISGNICQENRCWYYRYPNKLGGRIDCVRKGGEKCFAVTGDHRYHSIFGAVKKCIAVNPSDTAPALIVLNAEIITTKRVIKIRDFFSAENGASSTVLEHGEIVKEIFLPAQTQKGQLKSSFQKIAFRKSIDFAILNCAVSASIENNIVESCSICLNGVYNNPLECSEASLSLIGKTIDSETALAVAELAISNAKPLIQNVYKVQMAKTIISDTLLSLV